ncbi:MAG: family peptidase [Gemmatimonadetes bacterium]|nr:family peptidase [Gemmatimonadota bacterium]
MHAAFVLAPCLLAAAAPPLAGQGRVAPAREEMYQRYRGIALAVRTPVVEPHWLADGTSFWYAQEVSADSTVIYVVAPPSPARPLLDVGRVRAAVRRALGQEPPGRGLPFTSLALVDGGQAASVDVRGQRLRLRLADYAVTRLGPAPPDSADRTKPRIVRPSVATGSPATIEVPTPDRRWFATIRKGNLALRSGSDDEIVPLTADSTAGVEWEMNGAKWSPDGRRVAARRVDMRGVGQTAIVHWLAREERIEWIPYPRVDGAHPRTDVVIVDRASGAQRRLANDGDAESSCFIIGWRPDGSELLYARLSRDVKRVDILAANPVTGAVRTVLTERASTFLYYSVNFLRVSPAPGMGPPFTPVGNWDRFIWASERSGVNQLYLYDRRGSLIRPLTRTAFPVESVLAVDERAGVVYFTAQGDSARPYDTHLYRVGLDGEGLTRVTEAPGQHEITFSPSRAVFLDRHSSLDRAPVVDLRTAAGRKLQELARMETAPLTALRWAPPEEFVVKAADGVTNLHGVLYKPFDFDARKRYPVIEMVYAGPQRVNIRRTFLSFMGLSPAEEGPTATTLQALAQLGYIGVIIDARGTPLRGKAFQDVVYGNFGRHEIPDHVAALRGAAATRPYMDLGRAGVFGHSFGGYFSLRALLLAPDVYRVAVASGMSNPGPGGSSGGSLEGYLGLAARNPGAYQHASNLPLLERLRGELLIITGTADANTPFAESARIIGALVAAQKHHQVVLLPERNHITTFANGYWNEAVRRHFVANLPPEGVLPSASP